MLRCLTSRLFSEEELVRQAKKNYLLRAPFSENKKTNNFVYV